MKFKNIHFILNPAAGSSEPVLADINKLLCDSGVNWEVSVTRKNKSAYDIARSVPKEFDVIAVYGGDGSVTEVAKALCGTNRPMAIIPGGTANVLAKELHIYQDVNKAIAMLVNNECGIRKIDMGVVNATPFILRVNLGIMADMITTADPGLKHNLGQLAYGISALKSLIGVEPQAYSLIIDGEKINERGVTLTVTNAGSLGIGEFSLLPDIDVSDGLLDVVLLNNSDLRSVLEVAGTTLFQKDSSVLKHWKCKTIEINIEKSASFICDDTTKKAKRLRIKVLPAALNMVVPKGSVNN